MWQAVTSQADADHLLEAFGGFHDACVREARLWGGYFVSEKLSMRCPDTPDLRCRILFQRQYSPVSAIELFFDQVSQFRLASTEGYDRIISSAVLRVENGHIFWSPELDALELNPGYVMETGIHAKRLWWREVQNGLGQVFHYIDIEPLPGAPVP